MDRSDIQKDLLSKIAKGDAGAFRRFYDIHSGTVHHYACYFIHSEEIREEIVSDVFLNLWLRKEKLTEIENLDAYLFIVTRNKALNYIDKKARITESITDLALEIQTDKTDPEEILLSKELEKLINSTIEKLSERCRIVFLMSREENLRYREIAERLAISEKTVHIHMVVALKKIHAAVKDYLGVQG